MRTFQTTSSQLANTALLEQLAVKVMNASLALEGTFLREESVNSAILQTFVQLEQSISFQRKNLRLNSICSKLITFLKYLAPMEKKLTLLHI